jgi:hypothetical protein
MRVGEQGRSKGGGANGCEYKRVEWKKDGGGLFTRCVTNCSAFLPVAKWRRGERGGGEGEERMEMLLTVESKEANVVVTGRQNA